MLVAILWLGYQGPALTGGGFTTDLHELYAVGPALPAQAQLWMFLAFALSFAIKVPVFPLHTWGDGAIVGSDMHGETVQKLSAEGVILNLFGAKTEDGGVETKGHGVPHVERFFYIWTFLQEHTKKYDRVITTDTRDVVFQANPSRWLDGITVCDFVASGEGMRYKNEPCGNQNLYHAYGPHYHKLSKGQLHL